MTPEEEPRWRAAIGGNADRYLKFFRKLALSGRRWMPNWNSAAFLHSTGWFCYRRMYGWAFGNLFAPWLVLLTLIVASWMVPGRNLDALALALLIVYLAGVFILVPVFADSLYHRHVAGRLPRAQPPSVWTGLGAAALGLAFFTLVLAMLLPAYGDYTPRAKVSEAVLATIPARTGVTEFYAEHQRFPDAAEGRRIAGEPVSARVQSVVWEPAQRAIVVTLRDPFPGKRFALRAAEVPGGLSWKCGTIDLDRKHLPGPCRD